MKQNFTKKTTLELLLMALAQLYPLDRLSPGVTVAYLPKENLFYGSIVRYDQDRTEATATTTTSQAHRVSGTREVLLNARDETIAGVVSQLALRWHEDTQPTLIAFVNAVKRNGKKKGGSE